MQSYQIYGTYCLLGKEVDSRKLPTIFVPFSMNRRINKAWGNVLVFRLQYLKG